MSVTITGCHVIEKFFPSVNRTLKKSKPSSYECEIQSTGLSQKNSGVGYMTPLASSSVEI
jgi:hypothetical protein